MIDKQKILDKIDEEAQKAYKHGMAAQNDYAGNFYSGQESAYSIIKTWLTSQPEEEMPSAEEIEKAAKAYANKVHTNPQYEYFRKYTQEDFIAGAIWRKETQTKPNNNE
jgi:hypothetical protein